MSPERPAAPVFPVALAVTLVALVVRIAFVLQARGLPGFLEPVGESAVVLDWVRGAFSTDEPQVWPRPPLYAGLVELLAVSRDTLPRLFWFQAVLGSLAAGFGAAAAGRIGGRVAGLVAGLLLALAWPGILYAGLPLSTTLATLLLAVAVEGSTRAALADSRSGAITAAAALGLGAITLPWMLLLVPGLGWLLWRHAGLPRGLAVALVVVALLPSGGVTARNGIVAGEWTPARSVSELMARNHDARGQDPSAVVPPARDPGPAPLPASEPEVEEVPVLANLGARAPLLVGTAERFDRDANYLAGQTWLAGPWPGWAWLWALAFLGVILARGRRGIRGVGLLLVLGMLGLLLVVPDGPRRWPLAVLLAVLGGVGVARAFADFATRRAATSLALLGALAMGLVSWAPSRGRTGDPVPEAALARDARAHVAQGDTQGAWTLLRDAILARRELGRDPADADGLVLRRELVRVLGRLRQLDEMDLQLEDLVARYPTDPSILTLRGDAALFRERWTPARQFYKAALDADPTLVDARLGLAWVHLNSNERFLAQRLLRQVLAREPRNPRAHVGLGWIAWNDHENLEEAGRRARRALAVDRYSPEAHHLAGEVYRNRGEMKPAIWHLREAARLDPYNFRVVRWINRSGLGTEHPPGEEDNMP